MDEVETGDVLCVPDTQALANRLRCCLQVLFRPRHFLSVQHMNGECMTTGIYWWFSGAWVAGGRGTTQGFFEAPWWEALRVSHELGSECGILVQAAGSQTCSTDANHTSGDLHNSTSGFRKTTLTPKEPRSCFSTNAPKLPKSTFLFIIRYINIYMRIFWPIQPWELSTNLKYYTFIKFEPHPHQIQTIEFFLIVK